MTKFTLHQGGGEKSDNKNVPLQLLKGGKKMTKFTLHQGGGEKSDNKNVPLQLLKGGKNMIQLTNMVFRNNAFKSAFMKLGSAEINHKAFYSVKRVMDKIQQRSTELLENDKKLRDQYMIEKTITNEDGTEAKTKVFANEDEANAAFKALYETEFEVEVTKIPLADIEHLRFTPPEWEALAPLIAE